MYNERMEERIHKGVAEAHYRIAEAYNTKIIGTTENKKINRIVAAQNYFYAIINAIEAVFAKELDQHSFNHENRYRKILEYNYLFSEDILDLFKKVDRNERNKVAYKGQNGSMYEHIKKLANLVIKW